MGVGKIYSFTIFCCLFCFNKVVNSLPSSKSLIEDATPFDLDINKKSWNYNYEYSHQNGSDYFEPINDSIFSSVSEGQHLIWRAKTVNECSYLVVRGESNLNIYQLNGNLKKFNIYNGKWVDHKNSDQSTLTHKKSTNKPFLEKSNNYFVNKSNSHIYNTDSPFVKCENCKHYNTNVNYKESYTSNTCTNVESGDKTLKYKVLRLENELLELKQEYDQFRSKVLSVDNSLGKVVEAINTL